VNLILTEVCNRGCPYCFAQKQGASAVARCMSMAEVETCIDFAVKSGQSELRFLGGEPSLHPQFMDLVRLVGRRRLALGIFSNGLWPDAVQSGMADYLGANPGARLGITFNINEPPQPGVAESPRQAESLRIAGPRGQGGFNIYQQDFDLRFLGDLIRQFSMKRIIRVGVASPIVGVENAFLDFAALCVVGRRLVPQALELKAQGILLSMDCGVPLCMFSDSDRKTLAQCIPFTDPLSHCDGAIDVGPGLVVWPCFPLRGLSAEKLTDFGSYKELRTDFATKMVRNASRHSRFSGQ